MNKSVLQKQNKVKIDSERFDSEIVKENIRNPKRNNLSILNHILNKKLKSNESTDDNHLYCYSCNKEYVGECVTHKSRWILNKRITCPYTTLRANKLFEEYYNEKMEVSECYCKGNCIKHIKSTLPKEIFLIKSDIPNTTYGIWTNISINQGTLLGPFVGTLVNEDLITDSSSDILEDGVQDFVWSLKKTNNVENFSFVDARNCMTANYMRFIRCSNSESDINLIPLQFDGKIFYQALKTILPRHELIVSYRIKTYQPQNCVDSIIIRKLPSKGKQNNIKMNDLNFLTVSLLSSSTLKKNTHNSTNLDTSNVTKVDKDVKKFLKETVTKYPLITETEANQLLRKKMPHKTFLSDLTVRLLTQEYDVDPILGMEEILDEDSAYELIKMFRMNPGISLREVKLHIDKLFPHKSPITYETIDRLVRMNKLPSGTRQRQKINSNLCDAISMFLESDPWMSSKDLNNLLQDVFPEGPKISLQYLNQVISKYKLRPIKNARVKIDNEMKKYILDLFYRKKFGPSEISQKLNDKFPERPFISSRCIRRMIKMNGAVAETNEEIL